MDMNPGGKKGRQMPVKAFRLEQETIAELEKIAGFEKTSVNAVVNSALRDYTKLTYYVNKMDIKLVEGAIMKQLIECLPPERVEACAKEIGVRVYNEMITLEQPWVNLRNFLDFVADRFFRYSNWASYAEGHSGGKLIINLNHNVGMNWSILMKGVFYELLSRVKGVEVSKVTFFCTDNGLLITVANVA